MQLLLVYIFLVNSLLLKSFQFPERSLCSAPTEDINLSFKKFHI